MIYNLQGKIKVIEIIIALSALIIGGMIYIIYRTDTLLMFSWFNKLHLNDIVCALRENYGNSETFDFIKFNSPAALWLFSYMLLIDAIWFKFGQCAIYLFFISILPCIAISSEILQYFALVPGTFDIKDLIAYIVSIFTYLIIKLIP
jgi:hypothetical protein